MSQNQFFVRRAVVEDVEIILQLVIDLATYEKAAESVKATPELLRKNLFERPYAHTLLAVSGSPNAPGEIFGLAMYFYNFSTWTGKPGIYLEDLFVKPQYRGLGTGKAFFGELAKIAQAEDCARIDWSVLKWNTPSIDFYEKALGATRMDEWMVMRLEDEDIEGVKKLAV